MAALTKAGIYLGQGICYTACMFLSNVKLSSLISPYRYSRGVKVSFILHLHDISQNQVTEAVRINLQILGSILGERFYSRLVIGTTRWGSSMSTIRHGEHREEELKEGELKNLLQGGARMARIENGAEEPHGPTSIKLTTPFARDTKGVQAILASLIGLGLRSPSGDAIDGQGPLILDEICRLGLHYLETTAGRITQGLQAD